MRASQHHAPPQPLPLPPPPLSLPSPSAAPRRGHHRSSHSSSSSSSISGASTFCPSPPPRASTTSSLVPFSWERHAGVPKNSSRGGAASPTGTPLPLPLPPPPLRPAPRRRRRRQRAAKAPATSSSDARDDPFVAALTECTRDDGDGDGGSNKLWLVPAKAAVVSTGRAERRWWIAAGGLVAFLDMHGCKSAEDVVAAANRSLAAPVRGTSTSS